MLSSATTLAAAAAVLLAPSVLAVSGTGQLSYYGDNWADPSPKMNTGACGYAASKVSDMFAAINSNQYDGGAHCGKCVKVTGYGLTPQVFQIVDECPGCGWGGLDLSHMGMGKLLGGYDKATQQGLIHGASWYETDCCELWGTCGGNNNNNNNNQPPPQNNNNNNNNNGGAKKGSWEFCNTNNECQNNCCSKKWSDDGRYKCTPGLYGNDCSGSGSGSNPAPAPAPTSVPYSKTRQCGPSYGRCAWGVCCSKKGWCGTDNRYCGYGNCWSGYGKCW